jgi:hypothetical protein
VRGSIGDFGQLRNPQEMFGASGAPGVRFNSDAVAR